MTLVTFAPQVDEHGRRRLQDVGGERVSVVVKTFAFIGRLMRSLR